VGEEAVVVVTMYSLVRVAGTPQSVRSIEKQEVVVDVGSLCNVTSE